MNLYAVLGVSSEASSSDIKAAFRRKIKELHPDTRTLQKDASTLEVHQLIEAYEILTDTAKRQDYDKARHTAPRDSEFNYRDWLRARPDDLSKAKLIFYDVLRERSSEAVSLYTTLTRERAFQLEALLGKEDFMDCAFMLAMEFEAQGDDVQAVQLYLRICQLEKERPYFRHFFAEVEEKMLRLITVKISWQIDPPALVRIIEELQTYPFRERAKAIFLAKQAEVYWNAGQRLLAKNSLARAKVLAPKERAVIKLEKSWS